MNTMRRYILLLCALCTIVESRMHAGGEWGEMITALMTLSATYGAGQALRRHPAINRLIASVTGRSRVFTDEVGFISSRIGPRTLTAENLMGQSVAVIYVRNESERTAYMVNIDESGMQQEREAWHLDQLERAMQENGHTNLRGSLVHVVVYPVSDMEPHHAIRLEQRIRALLLPLHPERLSVTRDPYHDSLRLRTDPFILPTGYPSRLEVTLAGDEQHGAHARFTDWSGQSRRINFDEMLEDAIRQLPH